MNINDERKLYSNVRNLLNDSVKEQFVFPKFYIEINKGDKEHLKNLSRCKAYTDIISSENFEQRIKDYNELIQKIFWVTEVVSKMFDYPHFDFFQKIMEDPTLFEKFKNADLSKVYEVRKKLSSGEVKPEEALKELVGLSLSAVKMDKSFE